MATESIETFIDLNEPPQGNNQDQKQVATDGGDDIQIEEVDDRPPGDRDRKPPKDYRPGAHPTDEELGSYTQGVQERMKQMRWEYHEERRQKEAWQRENQAAIEFAKRVHAENQQMRQLLSQGHQTLLQTQKVSAEGEMRALQESLKSALDTGDTAKAAELQGKIAQAAARSEAVNYVQPIQFDQQPELPPMQQGWQQPQRQQQVQLSADTRKWLNENPWFNGSTQNEQMMTAVAMAVHNNLQRQGVSEGSPEYWSTINRAVRERFPEYNGFSSGSGSSNQTLRRAPVGAPTRTANTGGTRVGLTSSELAVARKMGISPKAYAEEKLRLQQEANNG